MKTNIKYCFAVTLKCWKLLAQEWSVTAAFKARIDDFIVVNSALRTSCKFSWPYFYGLSSALNSYGLNRLSKNFAGWTVQMRSFAQDVSNFTRTYELTRWFHYRGQKFHEKDDRKYLSFFVPKTPCKKYAIMWRKSRQGKHKQNFLQFNLSPHLLHLLSNTAANSQWKCLMFLYKLLRNSSGIKKYRSLYRTEHTEQGRMQLRGRRFYRYIVLFREQLKNWFCGWVQNRIQSAPRSEFSSTIYRGKKKTFFLSRLINQSIYVFHICAEKRQKAFYFLLNDQSVGQCYGQRPNYTEDGLLHYAYCCILLSWNDSNYFMYF